MERIPNDSTSSREERLATEIQKFRDGKIEQHYDEVTVLRFVIRSARIAVGLTIALAAFWAGSAAFDIAAEPLASLTILKIVGLLFLGWLAYVLAIAAFEVAFGEGLSQDDKQQRLEDWIRRKAIEEIARQDAREAVRIRDAHQQEWIAKQARKIGGFAMSIFSRAKNR